MQRSKDRHRQSVLAFYHVGSGERAQVTGLGGERLYQATHQPGFHWFLSSSCCCYIACKSVYSKDKMGTQPPSTRRCEAVWGQSPDRVGY